MINEYPFEPFLANLDCRFRFQFLVSLTATFSVAFSTLVLFAPIFTDDFYYTSPNCSLNRSKANQTLQSKEPLVGRFHLQQCDEQSVASISLIVLTVGFLLGTGLGISLANRAGRRMILILSLINTLIVSLTTILAYTQASRIVLRLFLGLSLSSGIVSSLLYVSDIVCSRRINVATFPSFAVPVSMLLLSLLAFFIPNYIHLQVTLSVIGLIPLVMAIVLPESPRWRLLTTNAQDAGLLSALKKISRWNNNEHLINIPYLSEIKLESKVRIFTLLHDRTASFRVRVVFLWAAIYISFLIFFSTGFEACSLPPSTVIAVTVMALADLKLLIIVHLVKARTFRGQHVHRWMPTCLTFNMFALVIACLICAVVMALWTDYTIKSQPLWILLCVFPVHGLAMLMGRLALELLLQEAQESPDRSAFLASGLQVAFLASPLTGVIIPFTSYTICPGSMYAIFGCVTFILAVLSASLLCSNSRPGCLRASSTTVAGNGDDDQLLAIALPLKNIVRESETPSYV